MINHKILNTDTDQGLVLAIALRILLHNGKEWYVQDEYRLMDWLECKRWQKSEELEKKIKLLPQGCMWTIFSYLKCSIQYAEYHYLQAVNLLTKKE